MALLKYFTKGKSVEVFFCCIESFFKETLSKKREICIANY